MSGAVRPSLSVVVPAYRSPHTLPDLVDGVLATVRERVADVEFIFVDDGSPDDTWVRLAALCRLLLAGAGDADVAQLRAAQHVARRGACCSLRPRAHDGRRHAEPAGPGAVAVRRARRRHRPRLRVSRGRAAERRIRNLASKSVKKTHPRRHGRRRQPEALRVPALPAPTRRGRGVGARPVRLAGRRLSWATARQVAVPVRFDVRSGRQLRLQLPETRPSHAEHDHRVRGAAAAHRHLARLLPLRRRLPPRRVDRVPVRVSSGHTCRASRSSLQPSTSSPGRSCSDWASSANTSAGSTSDRWAAPTTWWPTHGDGSHPRRPMPEVAHSESDDGASVSRWVACRWTWTRQRTSTPSCRRSRRTRTTC